MRSHHLHVIRNLMTRSQKALTGNNKNIFYTLSCVWLRRKRITHQMQDEASSTGQPLRDAQQTIESLSGRCSKPAGPQQTAADGSALSAQMASVRTMPPNSTRIPRLARILSWTFCSSFVDPSERRIFSILHGNILPSSIPALTCFLFF